MSEVVKRVAADGTQRGLHMKGKKHRRTELMEACQANVEAMTGIKDWDPVVMLAVIAAQAFTGYPAVDDEGQPILDDDDKPVMVPPDRAMAAAVAAKAAPYLHQHLKPKEVEAEKDTDDPNETRDKVLDAFESMGVKVERGDT